MTEPNKTYRGGCLCGSLRYEARGEPSLMGHCYCADCRKASGSGFVAFMGFARDQLHFSGEARSFASPAANGGEAVRNRCAVCGSLVFGGILGVSDSFTIYAGSLDHADSFRPTIAIFTRDRPPWAVIAPHLIQYETMPG